MDAKAPTAHLGSHGLGLHRLKASACSFCSACMHGGSLGAAGTTALGRHVLCTTTSEAPMHHFKLFFFRFFFFCDCLGGDPMDAYRRDSCWSLHSDGSITPSLRLCFLHRKGKLWHVGMHVSGKLTIFFFVHVCLLLRGRCPVGTVACAKLTYSNATCFGWCGK